MTTAIYVHVFLLVSGSRCGLDLPDVLFSSHVLQHVVFVYQDDEVPRL